MEFRSIEGESYIALTEWEVDHYGVKAAIAVRDGGFTGANPEVWFFREAFTAFVQALSEFTRAHEGGARVESMSPSEATLSIRCFDVARHVVAEAQLASGHFVGFRPVDNQVSITFELDTSQLPEMVRALEAVIADAEP